MKKRSKRMIAFAMAAVMFSTIGAGRINAKADGSNKDDMETDMIRMGYGETLGDENGFPLIDQYGVATVYVDTAHEEISEGSGHEYCGLEIIAETFADDVEKVTGTPADMTNNAASLNGNVIIAGTVGNCDVINALESNGVIDTSGLYKDDGLKWDCYQMQFVSSADMAKCGYDGIEQALVITGSNKRGAMYGLFHISERIGVPAWVYMADAHPEEYYRIYLDSKLLEFNQDDMYLSKEPSIKYRGLFINDESPSFTGWANSAFGGLNENMYQHVFELLIRMKANYMWPAMWGNSFSDEGKAFKLANVVLADAYGVCMGTSHHEACCRAGIEWQKIYRQYGNSNAWDYGSNSNAIYKFWEDGIKRNGDYESTITMGMRGEGDSALSGGVQYNINILKTIITDQHKIIDNYKNAHPDSKINDALKVYIPYSENEEFYYGPDNGSIDGLNKWEGMDDITIMMTDDNYGNIRSLPEESVRYRDAGWGLYYHLDGHVGTGAYEWVSSTQLEHIWDQLTMAYDYNLRNVWVINVGDIKPVEMELNYSMALAYDMDKWGQENTAKAYREQWLQDHLGGENNCPDEIAAGVAECVADFLKISTYRKPEYVASNMYSVTNYNEIQNVLALCQKTVDEANYYYDNFFKGTRWDDAYYQIVYYQAVGTANVTMMQIYKGLSDYFGNQNSSLANVYADMVNAAIQYDKDLTDYYNNKMSNKKWYKMMSSPHVGFRTWNSDGWSYPSANKKSLGSNAKMLVTPEGSDKAYTDGTAALETFTNTQKQRCCVTLSNGGTNSYDFTVASLADWIMITDKTGEQIVNGGTVKDAGYFYISVDWSRVRSEKEGTVVIKGAGATVKLSVKTEYTEYKSKGIGTYFESNDVVSIDAEKYADNVPSDNGVTWSCIDGYGRYRSAMKMLPSTVSFTNKTGSTHTEKGGNTTRTVTEYYEPYDAPYMEYQVYVDEEADYTFTAYTTPTNNIYKPMGWGYVPVELFYGIQVDDEEIKTVNSLPAGKYISYAADGDNQWIQGIKNNIHVSTSVEHMTEGLHKVKFYGMHAGLALERLVISNKALKSSYLGPQETFMLDYDIIPEQKCGVNCAAGAGTGRLSYGDPQNIEDITDPSDKNDQADEYEEETPIPGPVKPTPSPAPQEDGPAPAPVGDNSGTVSGNNNGNVSGNNKGSDSTGSGSNAVVKGKLYKVGNFKYKVTKLNNKSGEVTLAKVVKKKAKVKVPATVKIKKLVFKITEIGKNAFKNNKKLQSISIGKNVKKIGRNAFAGCKKLKKATAVNKKMSIGSGNALLKKVL